MSMEPVGSGLKQGERHYDEMAALYEIAALSAAQQDRSLLINEILRIVGHAVRSQQVLLFIHHPGKNHLDVHDERGALGPPFPIELPGVVARVFHGRTSELVNDLTHDDEGDAELKARLPARQILASPLVLGDHTLGVLAAVNSGRGAFAQEDLRMMSILADRVALTLENSHLVSTLQRQVRELQGLQRLSRLLMSFETLESMVDQTVRVVMELIPCEKIALMLYDPVSDSLIAHKPVLGITDEELAQLRLPLAEPSMGGTVFRTNTPLSSNDAANDAWVSRGFQQLLGIETLLVVPLTTGPKPLGVLKIINSASGYFSEQDLEYAALLGRQVGGILESNLARSREKALVRELREADRTKSEFVSMLAHELKGPMTTVLGFSQTLRQQWEKLDDGKRNHVLDIIHKEVGRLSRLVNDLLDVSRMESGTLRYELEPIDLHEVVESLLTVHTSLRSEHAVIDQLPAGLPKVMADKDRIRQVIINLLTNATRYSPERSTVTLGADLVEEGGETFVRLSVTDEGIGISPHDVDRIFSKFAMLPKPSWTKKGTGLGLYITKGIVEALGGRIWVESEVGRGSTFYVTLRVAADESGS
jgi:signal transduction histidine kinase